MSDWFTAATEMQREMIRAQKAQLDAAGKMIDAGQKAAKQFDDLQAAGRKATEANLKAWQQWAEFWGWK